MIKIQYRKQLHIFNQELNLETINKYITETFKHLPENYQIGYFDEEGDRISISTLEDLQIFKTQNDKQKEKLVIFDLEGSSDEQGAKKSHCKRFRQLTEEQKEEFRKRGEELKQKRKEERRKFFEEKKARFFEKVQKDEKLSKIMTKLQEKVKEALPKIQEFVEKDLSFKNSQQKVETQENEKTQKDDDGDNNNSNKDDDEHFPIFKLLGLKQIFKFAHRRGIIPPPPFGKPRRHHNNKHHKRPFNAEEDRRSRSPECPMNFTKFGRHFANLAGFGRNFEPQQFQQDQQDQQDQNDQQQQQQHCPFGQFADLMKAKGERKCGRKGWKKFMRHKRFQQESGSSSSSSSDDRSPSADQFEKIPQQEKSQDKKEKFDKPHHHHQRKPHFKGGPFRGPFGRPFDRPHNQELVNNMVNVFKNFGMHENFGNFGKKENSTLNQEKAKQMAEILGGDSKIYEDYVKDNSQLQIDQMIEQYLADQENLVE